jgi:choline-sulfatase
MVHHTAPWVPHERHRDLYPAGSIPEPLTMWDDHSGRASVVQAVRMTIADDLTDADIKETVPAELLGAENTRERAAWKYQRYMRDSLQTVQAVDDGVGRLLDWLAAEGLAENTIVVYTSDQGFFLGDHGWFDKRLMYEQSLGMPLVIRWPAEITAGTRCQEMIINVDFAATFLDMCGLDPDVALPHQQGRSFRVLLRGTDVPDWLHIALGESGVPLWGEPVFR